MIKSLWLRKYKLSSLRKREGKCVDLRCYMGCLQLSPRLVGQHNMSNQTMVLVQWWCLSQAKSLSQHLGIVITDALL